MMNYEYLGRVNDADDFTDFAFAPEGDLRTQCVVSQNVETGAWSGFIQRSKTDESPFDSGEPMPDDMLRELRTRVQNDYIAFERRLWLSKAQVQFIRNYLPRDEECSLEEKTLLSEVDSILRAIIVSEVTLPPAGLPVTVTAGFPGLAETIIHRCATVKEAEDFLATSATIDPDHLAAGHYGIDAPEEMVNPPPKKRDVRDLLSRVLGFMEDSGDLTDKDRRSLAEDVAEMYREFGGE